MRIIELTNLDNDTEMITLRTQQLQVAQPIQHGPNPVQSNPPSPKLLRTQRWVQLNGYGGQNAAFDTVSLTLIYTIICFHETNNKIR